MGQGGGGKGKKKEDGRMGANQRVCHLLKIDNEQRKMKIITFQKKGGKNRGREEQKYIY